jgi:hypothetical protein
VSSLLYQHLWTTPRVPQTVARDPIREWSCNECYASQIPTELECPPGVHAGVYDNSHDNLRPKLIDSTGHLMLPDTLNLWFKLILQFIFYQLQLHVAK